LEEDNLKISTAEFLEKQASQKKLDGKVRAAISN
jgi:hypothetical protein